jgi:adenosylhomocysteine nucleosidase
MNRRPMVILTALRMEADALADVKGASAVHVIGMGARRIPRIEPGSCVIMAGLGGGLDPSLRVADLVIDTPVAALPLRVNWHVGAIHTVSAPVTTPAEKAALFRETRALAVDMELATVRSNLLQDVHVIGIRAISDPAEMAIDRAVLELVNAEGRPRPLRIAGELVRHPRLIRHLWELQINSRLALRHLALGTAALVEAIAADHSAGSS